MLFQPFNPATKAKTPDFVGAATAQGEWDQKAKQQENALRSQNLSGAFEVYNEATPDTTPIHDALFGTTEAAAPGAEALGIEEVGAAQMGTPAAAGVAPEAMAGAVDLAAPTAQLASGGAGVSAAPAAVAASEAAAAGAGAAGAGAAGAGATGALAAMGPVGWAAAAALALGLFS